MESENSRIVTPLRRQAAVIIPQDRPLLARHPWVGILVSLIGIAIFALLAYNVMTNGPLVQMDNPIAQALHYQARHGSWVVLGIMWFFSATGMEGVMMFILLLSIAWIIQKRWRELTMLIYGVGGAEGLFQTLGHIFNRHRPVFPDPLEHLSGPGFPSGHTTTSIVLFGLMLYVLWPRLHSGLARAISILLVLLTVGMIGFGRMYIGDHYLTDILGGAAAGLAWGALVFTGVEVAYWNHQPGGRKGIKNASAD
jgi:membrane-associated phospholipid phosphatase